MNSEETTYSDLCVCCGKPVPEGRMVCYVCEMGGSKSDSTESPVPKQRKKSHLAFIKALFAKKKTQINQK